MELGKCGINVVMVSRTESKMNEIAQDLNRLYNVKSKIIGYDFTNLRTPTDAQQLIDKIDNSTKGLDIGILVNNVGMISHGLFGNQEF